MPWLLLTALLAQRPSPPAEPLMRHAMAYVAAYEKHLGGLVAEEDYEERAFSYLRPTRRRTVHSDYVLIRFDERTWMPFRDVLEVDGEKVGNHEQRLETLFEHVTPDSLQDLSRRLTAENSKYAIAWEGNLGMPFLALTFLRAGNVDRFAFKSGGRDQIDGEPALRLDYKEIQRPTIIQRTLAGGDAPASGSFWIRVSDGAILRTTLRIGNPTPAAVEVQYCSAPHAGMLVPCTMIEKYDSDSGQVQNTAKYTNVRRFDVAVSTTIK